ncbi:molybdenum cofactor sulfurase [Striga asiatica]|uniref:Molybdenum cofactor sulfurase n=1 Tax=Striga asiatica TaxID=4170 RepID=A0A5A7Q5Z2_STRAF|nr:molybdenum cofactor sulfurase [Striga asiatica]
MRPVSEIGRRLTTADKGSSAESSAAAERHFTLELCCCRVGETPQLQRLLALLSCVGICSEWRWYDIVMVLGYLPKAGDGSHRDCDTPDKPNVYYANDPGRIYLRPGLLHDREWLLKSFSGEVLTLKKVPELGFITTMVDLKTGLLIAESPRYKEKLHVEHKSDQSIKGREVMEVYSQAFENLRCSREGLFSSDASTRLEIFGQNKP